MSKKIEKKVSQLLKSVGLEAVLPVNLEVIAQLLGLRVVKDRFEKDLSGALLRSPGKEPMVLINSSDSPNRQRFSLAHEIGHFFLGHEGEYFVDQFALNKRDVRSSYAIDPKEIEANAFAAALLMPENIVLQQAVELINSKKVTRQEALIKHLAITFSVSESAMGYRLVNLGLITAVG
jgi:Zn-dependent peptidase ImmA (M78 family)